MYLSAAHTSWPNTVLILGAVFAVLILIAFLIAAYVEMRKTNLVAKQESDLRALVGRYEQLAGNILDAQQRTATDVSELRARAAAIEQILRTVE
jgi:hypothetical protein